MTEHQLITKFINEFKTACRKAKKSTSKFTFHCRERKIGNSYSVCHNFQDQDNQDGIIVDGSYFDIYLSVKDKAEYQGLELIYSRATNAPTLKLA
ncbi:hypothetical protein [Vibrio crassostreae]|uniref:hypothetical protein n=1 Tax=Vibrio crassostreae TaxID=246167 RepID=UPI001B30B0BB|nr:hypothetical protein [Vibrio crassostreae]